ncbi:MAG: NeuD/PglB/VioB family sugar acetyltransferase [Acidimicrobiales bacterium]
MGLYVVGAGGFGRETLDALLAGGETPSAFLDERRAGETCRGLPVLSVDDAPTGSEFVVGIAEPSVRRRLVATLLSRGLAPRAVVHPAAVVGPETELGQGAVVLALAHISSNVQLGAHGQVNYGATIGHDALLGDFTTVLPGANIAGGVILEEDVTVGSNACILPGRRVGRGAVVGAGAVVTKDVAGGSVVVGVPAQPHLGHGAGPVARPQ